MGAEQENAPQYSEVRAKGVYKVPFCPDLRFNVCVWDIGISNYVMETGVILFDSLYITTALLYFILLLTESQSSSWNIKTDGVSK